MRAAFRNCFAVCVLSAACSSGSGDADTAPQLDAGQPLIDAGVQPLSDGAVGAPVVVNTSSALTGTLGATGAIQPIVSTLVISNSGETLIYLATAPLTCAQLTMSRWLGTVSSGAQVVEIVVSGAAKLGSAKNPEVNWATGGKSSSYEQNAKTASVTFTKSEPMGVVEGTVTATYGNPAGDLTGHFHAEFCPNGQDY